MIKTWRVATSMPSASAFEEGPNLLTLVRRAPNHRKAEQLSPEWANVPRTIPKHEHRTRNTTGITAGQHTDHPKDFSFRTSLAEEDTARKGHPCRRERLGHL